MNVNKINTVKFQGYKNVVSHMIDEGNGNAFCIMGMKLDNEKTPDLAKWESIQRDLLKRTELKDTIVFKTLAIGEEPLFFVDDIMLEPKQDMKKTALENNILKTLTLIASLTSRLTYDLFPLEDRNIHLTLVEMIKDLKKIFNDDSTCEAICYNAACKRVPHYKTSEHINTVLTKKMIKYFK